MTSEDIMAASLNIIFKEVPKSKKSYQNCAKNRPRFCSSLNEFLYVKNLELLSDPDYLKSKSAENRSVLDRGYMKAVGMILWAARNVFLECLVGVSFLCRVMSSPCENAWLCAMHMIKWIYQNRNRGLKFSSEGNVCPVAFSDASNKSDPHDGKCQFGFCIMLSGAPIIAISKKLNRVLSFRRTNRA